jgi:hypothetical protein
MGEEFLNPPSIHHEEVPTLTLKIGKYKINNYEFLKLMFYFTEFELFPFQTIDTKRYWP